MIIITGIITVESEAEISKVRDALVQRAQRSQKDAGCLDYVFCQSLENPCEIRLIEKWENEDLLNAHLKIPDTQFDQVIAVAKITSAIVLSNEVVEEKELLNR